MSWETGVWARTATCGAVSFGFFRVCRVTLTVFCRQIDHAYKVFESTCIFSGYTVIKPKEGSSLLSRHKSPHHITIMF